MSLLDFLDLCERQTVEVLVACGGGKPELHIWPLKPHERQPLVELWTRNYYTAQHTTMMVKKAKKVAKLIQPKPKQKAASAK